MRTLTTHRVNPVNDRVTATVIENPHGEPTAYQLNVPDGARTILTFQHGPINEVGVNGITNEVLLAIVQDRLRFFQQGKYACRENALALTKVDEAMLWLQSRTMRRMQEGVEGTNQPDRQ
jgi:hypothetical protein